MKVMMAIMEMMVMVVITDQDDKNDVMVKTDDSDEDSLCLSESVCRLPPSLTYLSCRTGKYNR